MIWGFSDRAIAETLKTMALSIGKGPNAVPDSLRDNGSRIFVVSLPEALDPLSKNGGTDLTPSSGTAKLLKKDLSTDALALRKSGNSEEDYTVPIFNLSGHSIPETPEEPKPEDLHLAIQDSFGALYLLPEVSELFGTLAESWEPGDTEPKTITLDEGFERSEDFGPFQAYPAPTLADSIDAGEAVTCRYVKAVGKWFFFKPSGATLPVVEINGNQLLGLGWHCGRMIFDLTLKRGFCISGTYQVVESRKTDVMLGNDWTQPALRHPVQSDFSSETLGVVVFKNGTPYTTSRLEITDLTSAEENYDKTPAFTPVVMNSEAFESCDLTGKTYPDGAANSYSGSGFYVSPWYGNGLNPTYLTDWGQGVNQRLFDPDCGKVCTQFGVPVALDAEISSRTHNSIDVDIGTPVYSSPHRPHCTLRVKKIDLNYYQYGEVFFDTKETIAGITYTPDYTNQKLTANNYAKFGEYRPTANLPNNFTSSVTLRFYYPQTSGVFVWTQWLNGTEDSGIYYDEDEEAVFIDKDDLFRWRIPASITGLSSTYTEQDPPEGETAEIVTFTLAQILDPDNGIEPVAGDNYSTIQYDSRTWSKTAADTQSSTEVPANTLEPTEPHPDIVLTFVEKIPENVTSRDYTWTDVEGDNQTVTLTHNQLPVYLVNVEKFQ